jgi:hypothetical protein
MPGDWDFGQQFRGYRRCDPARFFQKMPPYGAWKAADNFQTFEQCTPRPRDVRGAFSAGNPQEGRRAHGGIGLLSLSPRILQKPLGRKNENAAVYQRD